MAEVRDIQITVNIEPTYAAVVPKRAREQSMTMSNYIRSLIINDLFKSGHITSDTIVSVSTSSTKERLKKVLSEAN